MSQEGGSYSGVFAIWKRYWRAYGGTGAFLRSPYMHAAVLLTILTFPNWSQRGWWETVTSVLPNVLGFTLGGYAILLSFGDEKFKAILAGSKTETLDKDNGANPSAFLQVSAAFVHFIVVQAVAMFVALFAKAFAAGDHAIRARIDTPCQLAALKAIESIGSFLGYFVFLYALLCAVASAMYVFRLTYWFDAYLQPDEDEAPVPPPGEKKADNETTRV